MFIVGIDISKRNHEAVIMDEQGTIVQKAFSFPNTYEGYSTLISKILRITNIKSQVRLAMEATSHYWLPVYSRLIADGYTAHVINPRQTHALRELYLRQHKTDAKDAFIIAEVIRFGRFSDARIPPEQLLALRELCRHRLGIVDMASDLKRKVIALIDRTFPEYDTVFSSIFVDSSVAVLTKYQTPEKLRKANLTTLSNILLKVSNGRFGRAKAMEIKTLAKNSFGIPDCSGVYAELIKGYLAQIRSIQEQVDAIDARIKDLMEQMDSPITSISGIGPILGAVILAEIGDISQFPSADKLAAFAGLDPSVKQSGEMKSPSHMSKRGSPYLRRAIWMASTTAVMHDPMFKAYMQKKTDAGKCYRKAIGHVTKKMVSVIYAVLRDNKQYQPILPDAA
jgi:transposase